MAIKWMEIDVILSCCVLCHLPLFSYLKFVFSLTNYKCHPLLYGNWLHRDRIIFPGRQEPLAMPLPFCGQCVLGGGCRGHGETRNWGEPGKWAHCSLEGSVRGKSRWLLPAGAAGRTPRRGQPRRPPAHPGPDWDHPMTPLSRPPLCTPMLSCSAL